MPELDEHADNILDIATVTGKRSANDSVFCHLFSKSANLVKLYKVLTGDTITEDELQTVTLDSHLTNQLYNDLAFIARGKVLILLEAQSKWSINVVIRIILYLAALWNKYIKSNKLDMYGSSDLKLPAPKFYVVFTGGRANQPDYLSLKDDIFRGMDIDIDVKVKMLYGDSIEHNILDQYVAFCKVLNEQFTEYGRTMEAINETIRICTEKDILKEYLEKERREVIDIMENLLSQEEVLINYVEAQKEAAARAATTNTLLTSIQRIMNKLHVSAEDAMDTLDVPQSDRATYVGLLAKQ